MDQTFINNEIRRILIEPKILDEWHFICFLVNNQQLWDLLRADYSCKKFRIAYYARLADTIKILSL